MRTNIHPVTATRALTGAQRRTILLMVMGSLLILPLLLGACGGPSSYYGAPTPYYGDPLSAALGDLGDFLIPIRVLMAIAGLAMLLAGYKLYRYVIMIPGIILGGALGAAIGADENAFLAIVGLLLGALIGAGLALLIHDLLIFLIGAGIGVTLVAGISLANNNMPEAWAIIVGIIVGGVGLLALSKAAIIFYTSAVGSLLFGLGIEATGWWLLLFFAVGVGVQYGLARALGDSIGVGTGAAAAGAAGATGAGVVDALRSRKKDPAALVEPVQTPIEALPVAAIEAHLVDSRGYHHPMYDQLLIGRGMEANLRLPERNVSRRHALIRKSGGDWYIQDQGSAGGTFVNGKRVQASQIVSGDQVRIGDHTFRMELS